MTQVKIFQDKDISFDGIKVTSLKKGDDFNADKEQVKTLTDIGVILDPDLDKKDAKKKQEIILNERATALQKAKGSKKIKISSDNTGKFVFAGQEYNSLSEAKADLEEQLTAFEKAQAKFEKEKENFEAEKAKFKAKKDKKSGK